MPKRLGTTGVCNHVQYKFTDSVKKTPPQKTGPGPLTDYNSASQVLILLMWLGWKPVAPWALRTWMFLAQ